jgi:hypothetical protein
VVLRIISPGSSPFYEEIGQANPLAQGRGTPLPDGNGHSFDLRFLSLLNQVLQGGTEPMGLLTMSMAGGMFRLGRFGMMARLTTSPVKNFFNYGIGARIAAGLFGFSLELPTLTLTGHLAGKVLGRDASSWRHDLASNLLVMGSLRLAGGLGTYLSRLTGADSGWAPHLIAHTSMFGGILLGLHGEHWAGLRKFSSETNLVQESLQIFLQNQIAGHLSHPLLGPKFTTWEQWMDQKTEFLAQGQARPISSPLIHSIYAMAGGPGEVELPASEGRESSAEPTYPGGRVEKRAMEASVAEFHYPSEVEAAWRHLEERWSQKNYYEGSRDDLARRRPDLEAMDQIWLHQAEDYGKRIPGARVEVLDAEALLEPASDRYILTDSVVLDQALRALGERNRIGGLGRRLVRIHIPENFNTLGDESPQLAYLSQLPLLSEAEQNLARRVRFLAQDENFSTFDIPSLSLLETLAHTVLGKKSLQLHPVPGTIPRDTVMSLRSRRVSPVGFSRRRIFLGDVGREVHPFSLSGHDAFFHALMDANIFDPYLEIAGWLYTGIQKRIPEGSFKEALLDQLSDSNLGQGKTRIKHFAQHVLGIPLQRALYSAQLSENPHTNSERLKYLQELAEAYHTLVLEEFRTQPHLAGKEKFFLAPLHHGLRSIKMIRATVDQSLALGIEVPPPTYQGKILSAALRIDKKFKDPNYLQGAREELLARRVDPRDADALWFHQAKDYVKLFPGARSYTTGAEILTQKSKRKFVETDPVLLKQALSLLGKRNRANSLARQVLIIEIPAEHVNAEFLPNYPHLKFLSTFPLFADLEHSLRDRIHFSDAEADKMIIRVPSLSLAEKLLQAAHGSDHMQFHFVPGILPHDTYMELKGKRLAPVGLSFGPVYFGEIGHPIHPFMLTDHDAFEHAPPEIKDPLPNLPPEAAFSYGKDDIFQDREPVIYPPEMEKAWRDLEQAIQQKDYLKGSRDELLRKRPNEDGINALWLFQGEDYLRRFPNAQIRRLDAEDAFLSRNAQGAVHTDPKILSRALRHLANGIQNPSLARQVLQIEVPTQKLEEYLFDPLKPNSSMILWSLFVHAQELLENKVQLITKDKEYTLWNIPSLSLWERIIQVMAGRNSVQFQYVLGSLPQDLVMSLRAQRTPPVGLTRDPIFFGDLQLIVHPFYYLAHDVIFHGIRDALRPQGFPEWSQGLYRHLQEKFTHTYRATKIMDNLADLDEMSFFIEDLIGLLHLGFQRSLDITDPVLRRQELSKINEFSAPLSEGLRRKWPPGEIQLSSQGAASLREFIQLRRGINLELKKFSREKGTGFSAQPNPPWSEEGSL